MADGVADRECAVRVESVSVGLPADIELGGKRTTTGIFKRPVEGPVFAGLENLDGDGHNQFDRLHIQPENRIDYIEYRMFTIQCTVHYTLNSSMFCATSHS